MFHCLARCCADTLVGKTRASRSKPAWRHADRALEHGHARSQYARPTIRKFPPEIGTFAILFVDIQHKRHGADYDPFGRWYKSEVAEDIDTAADIIDQFERAPMQDRRAFAVYVLLRSRKI